MVTEMEGLQIREHPSHHAECLIMRTIRGRGEKGYSWIMITLGACSVSWWYNKNELANFFRIESTNKRSRRLDMSWSREIVTQGSDIDSRVWGKGHLCSTECLSYGHFQTTAIDLSSFSSCSTIFIVTDRGSRCPSSVVILLTVRGLVQRRYVVSVMVSWGTDQ